MTTALFTVGQWVVKKGYNGGRTGIVEEIKQHAYRGAVYRVRWLLEADGVTRVFFGKKDPGTGNGVRTWVSEIRIGRKK